MSKQRSSRIKPYDLELEVPQDGTMILKFEDAKSKVSIEMPRWWVQVIAQKLHEFIQREQKGVDDIKKSLRGE